MDIKTVRIAAIAAVAALLSLPTAHAEENDARAKADPNRVSLFQVPLQCPAAPEIACGSASKPILLALESDANISEAWINRAGTVLAVVGTEASTRASRSEAVLSLLTEIFNRERVATEIDGQARDKGLGSFMSPERWYRSAQLDLLSAEESDIIAARLVRRIQADVTLSDEQVSRLEEGFSVVFERRFIRNSDEPALIGEEQRNEELLEVAREYLDAAGVAAFQGAIARGYRPGADER